jgi:hypothetical protein
MHRHIHHHHLRLATDPGESAGCYFRLENGEMTPLSNLPNARFCRGYLTFHLPGLVLNAWISLVCASAVLIIPS